jgi:hypothetical protein
MLISAEAKHDKKRMLLSNPVSTFKVLSLFEPMNFEQTKIQLNTNLPMGNDGVNLADVTLLIDIHLNN